MGLGTVANLDVALVCYDLMHVYGDPFDCAELLFALAEASGKGYDVR